MADYVSIADLKESGRLNIGSTAFDDSLSDIVTAASRWIDKETWDLTDCFAATATTTRYFRPYEVDGARLWLDKPLLSVSSITNGDSSSVSSGTYWLNPRNNPPYFWIDLKSTAAGWLFTVDGEISITGVWGYSAAVPAPVKEAAAMLAGWMFKRYQNALQDNSAIPELGRLTYSEAIPKQVRALIQPYRGVV